MPDSGAAKAELVAPRTLKGFRDVLPEEMIARNRLTREMQDVFERFGFSPLDSPILEHRETLFGTGGEDVGKEIFELESPEKEPAALRYDLTVPFARLVAQYPDKLKLPFRRYHIGAVFRADKPGAGRYRQFTQCDFDAAGSESAALDAEVIAVMAEVMKSAGLSSGEFEIRFSNRKLLRAFLDSMGLKSPEEQSAILRVIDKLQKVGLEEIRRELGPGRMDKSGDYIRGAGLDAAVIDSILKFIAVGGATRAGVLDHLAPLLDQSDAGRAALLETRELDAALTVLGLAERDVILDPSLARGLAYYTGPVYEAVLPAAPELGSVMGGGRYNNLVDRFLPSGIPSTGASVGMDRLVAALMRLGKLETTATVTEVLVLSMRGIPATELLRVATALRNENIRAEVYFGDPNTAIRHQLSFANEKRIPVGVIIGEDELKTNQVSIKDLTAGLAARSGAQDHETFRKAGKTGQVTVPFTALVSTVREILARRP